ncbi:MAG: ribbon-helix-helix protein, CopG family [Clostridia bacterium]|nr:ribbon-helix-helix protein, CopG family [Clostridia bacterium]
MDKNNNENKKLIITPKKYKAESTTIISARVSMELMEKIEDIAKKTNRNRNEIIQILLDFAVDNTIIDEK